MKPIIFVPLLICIAIPGLSGAKTQTDEPYNPNKALALGLATTLSGTAVGVGFMVPNLRNYNSLTWVGYGILGASLVIGPSTGIYYAGRPIRASITMAVRALVVGGWIGAHAYEINQYTSNESTDNQCGAPLVSLLLLLPNAAIATLILVINDIAAAPYYARKSNEEQRRNNMVSLAPTVFRTHNGTQLPGLVIGGEF